ncbi:MULTISPECIES: DMT family transporter [Brevibacillus]|uniref:DMT family transporter n=1 Tax=Brevibacillus TaxID=55080 RepID=UPI000E2F3D79|nr:MULTISPECIES: DMT family transporter [Brevibacillus]MED1790216.1 DMT family transporter [Brevibacillus laterosporus]RFB28478.1 DMT family transporter [Brevibacillus sp. VP]
MGKKDSYIYVILTSVVCFWGLNVVMVKYLSFFPPVVIAAIRMLIAAIVLTPILFVKKKEKCKLSVKQWLFIVAIGSTSIALHQILLAWGLQHSTAGSSSLILALNPLATTLLAALLLGEKLSIRKGMGILLGFTGVIIAVTSKGDGHISFGLGEIIIFGSMLMYVAGGLFVRGAKSTGLPVWELTAYSQWIGAIILAVLSIGIYPTSIFQEMNTSWFTWFVIFCSGGISSGLGSLGWNYGIQKIGASQTSIFLNGMPIASLLFAAWLINEPLTYLAIVALLCTIAGVYLGSTSRSVKILVCNKRREV